ncbi:MAG: D-alanyl-D-alanine carboxypeptidase, partial [Planctomycetota bacterium]
MEHPLRAIRHALLLLVLLHAPIASAQSVQRDVERLIASSSVADATFAVAALELGSGRVVASLREDEALIPASNMKLLSTGAALDVLGPEHAYRTRFEVLGDQLIVVGAGDPALGDPDLLAESPDNLTPEGLLDGIVERVLATIGGPPAEIVLDDRVFDRQRQHPSWDPDDVNKSWQAEVAGLGFHANLLSVFPSAS